MRGFSCAALVSCLPGGTRLERGGGGKKNRRWVARIVWAYQQQIKRLSLLRNGAELLRRKRLGHGDGYEAGGIG
jgi:hypothetical protein